MKTVTLEIVNSNPIQKRTFDLVHAENILNKVGIPKSSICRWKLADENYNFVNGKLVEVVKP